MNFIHRIAVITVFFACKASAQNVTNSTIESLRSPCLPGVNSSVAMQYQYNSFCYWFPNESHASWRRAYLSCMSAGSNLASIHSIEELNTMKSKIQGTTENIWIGMRSFGTDLPYEWSDKTPVDFVNWEDGDSGYPTRHFSLCVALSPQGYFVRRACFGRYMFICKDKLPEELTTASLIPTTTVTPRICPDEWDHYGDKCYSMFGVETQEKQTWHDANQICKDMGATLLSIHSKEEQDFMYMMMSGKTDMAWIGFHEVPSTTDRAFHWSDESPMDYTYWDTNQPNNWNSYKEECGNMRFGSPHLGRWNDAECQLLQSYICQLHTDPKKAKFAQDADTCIVPEGWMKLGSSCYRIFSGDYNDVTWSEAQYFCSDFGGNLVTVRNLKESIFLRFHLADFKDKFWIGLKNEGKNKRYSWVTGPDEFSSWDAEQPNELSDGPNCVVTNTHGRWSVRSCSENLPFVCEVDEDTPEVAAGPGVEGTEKKCPNGSAKWKDYGSSFCYIIELKDKITWYEAAHRCFQQGGYLSSFHSLEEVNVTINQVTDYTGSLHIGLGQKHDGEFEWDDRSAVDFVNWDSGLPNSNSQMCVQMNLASGKWRDVTCETKSGYICSVLKVDSSGNVTTAVKKIPADNDVSPIGVGGILGIVLSFAILGTVIVGIYFCFYSPWKIRKSISHHELCDEEL